MANETIRTLIVDDEPFARQRVCSLLANEPDVRVIGECADGPAAVTAMREVKPDLVFLDIQMPELDGFEVLKALGPEAIPVIIFVTAHDFYAVRAFEVHAIDYLLKPFDDDRFHVSLQKARERIRSLREGDLTTRLGNLLTESRIDPTFQQRLVVRLAGSIRFLKVNDIDWIESAGNYASLHVGRKTHLHRESLKSLEARLDPRRFVRIHRFAIVNLDRIAELRPLASGDHRVILQDGTKLTLSRSHVGRMKSLLL